MGRQDVLSVRIISTMMGRLAQHVLRVTVRAVTERGSVWIVEMGLICRHLRGHVRHVMWDVNHAVVLLNVLFVRVDIIPLTLAACLVVQNVLIV